MGAQPPEQVAVGVIYVNESGPWSRDVRHARTLTELLVYLAPHEARPIWQFKYGPGGTP